jgi:iron complex outermembrane receptor protein
MSNARKPNRATMEASTTSAADSQMAAVGARWLVAASSELRAGLDYSALQRDALRTRHMVGSGMTFYDHLWPDAAQDDLGLYAEYSMNAAGGWKLRFGGRYDHVDSTAAAADDPGLGGRSIREWYVHYYGPEAADTDRAEDLFTANVVASRGISDQLSLQAGLGYVTRAAGTTERYFAFAPAPGGFVVGNPSLDAERKVELSVGAAFGTRRFNGTADVYYYSFADYIYKTALEDRDVNNDGVIDRVFGFWNVDATFYGMDLSGVFQATPRLSFPVGLAYVHAENDDTGTPLPEIPPLEGRLAARFAFGGKLPGWVELGARLVDAQDRIDESFGESATPGFMVGYLASRLRLAGFAVLVLDLRNLLDTEYVEHLTRETALPVGGLQRGQKIPEPGRAFFASVRFTF